MKDLSLTSNSLLHAAIAGLLSSSLSACSTANDTNSAVTGTGASAGIGGETAASGGNSSSVGGAGGSESDCVIPQLGGASNDTAGEYVVYKTETIVGVTLEAFTEECDSYCGTVETHAHCGGANSCRGISYDEWISVRSEHSCAALNTCAGFSCVLPK